MGLCVPETGIGGFVGQELLLYEVVGEIVCVFVAVVIAEFCHEFGWGVADGQGNRQVACLLHVLKGCVDGEIGGVALGTRGEIDGGFCQWYASFGHTDFRHGIETGVGKKKGVGIGESDVLGCADDESASNEQWVFTSFNHAGEVVDGCVGVTSSDALDEG